MATDPRTGGQAGGRRNASLVRWLIALATVAAKARSTTDYPLAGR
jgi:hypothetical protein